MGGNEAVIDLKADNKQLKAALAQSEQTLQGWANTTKRIVGSVAAFVAAKLSINLVKGLMSAYEEQERAEAKLAAVIKATGQAAGYSSEQMQQMAGDMQKVTMYGDEVVLSAMSVLATFKEVKGDNFKAAMEAAADMSTVLGTDLSGSAMQLGKALNDPIRGMAALARSGVSLTGEQRALVASLVELGDVAGAQAVILEEMQTQFGGAAKAAADTDSGGLKQFQNRLGDIYEKFGEIAYKILGELMPVFDALATWFENVTPIIGDVITTIIEFAKTAWAYIKPLAEKLLGQLIERVTVVWMTFETLWKVVQEVWTQIVGWIGISTEDVGGFFNQIIDFIQTGVITAFITLMVVIENWRDVVKLAAVSAAYVLVRAWNEVVYLFTEVLPKTLTWMGKVWVKTFQNLAAATKQILSNIGKNLYKFFQAVKDWIAGKGFNFKWTGLLDGFEAATVEMPKIMARKKGPLEQQLENDMAEIGGNLQNRWNDKWEEFRKRSEENKRLVGDMFGPPKETRVDMRPNVRAAVGGDDAQNDMDSMAFEFVAPKDGNKAAFNTAFEGLRDLNQRITLAATSRPEKKAENQILAANQQQVKNQDRMIKKLDEGIAVQQQIAAAIPGVGALT